jgi:hypothetical protein
MPKKFEWKSETISEKEVKLNRIKFINEFKIKNFAYNISAKNNLRLGIWSDDYLNGKLDKTLYVRTERNLKLPSRAPWSASSSPGTYGDIGNPQYSTLLDHEIHFKTNDHKLIRVVSPYVDPYVCSNETDEIYKKNGYEKYDNLYSNGAITYIKVISIINESHILLQSLVGEDVFSNFINFL